MLLETTITIPLAELETGKMIVRDAGGREIMLCRTKDGLFAVDNVCSHAYARLNEGRLRGCRVICPLHGAAFDVRTGDPIGAPATRPIGSYPVRSDGLHAVITVPIVQKTS